MILGGRGGPSANGTTQLIIVVIWHSLCGGEGQLRRRAGVCMLHVYGDESADGRKHCVFAIACVVGAEEQWKQLESKWLARCGGVPFHAKDCDSDRGDFAIFPHEENKARYRELAILVAESGVGGFGIALDLGAQRRVFPEAPVELAFYKCFIEAVQKMRNCAAYNNEIVKFTFDKRPEDEHNIGVLYTLARGTKEWTPYIDSEIDFACARDQSRLQVADLFARETMKALYNEVGPQQRPPRKSWQCLAETGRFHIEGFGEEWFSELKAHMPDLEEMTGMSMANYACWLTTTGRRVDNISNRFDYIRCVTERDGP